MPINYNGGHTFKPGEMVPDSCIESAEYIIQVIKTDDKCQVTWNKAGETRSPDVYAEFQNRYINITKTENFINLITTDFVGYGFGNTLPVVGEGICIVNTGKDNDGYNMHFGGVIREARGRVEISSMNEPKGKVNPKALVTETISNVDNFRGETYADKAKFIIGKLTTTPDKSKTEVN